MNRAKSNFPGSKKPGTAVVLVSQGHRRQFLGPFRFLNLLNRAIILPMKAYREVDGGGDLFSALDHQKKVTQRIVGILKLRDLIDWESFRPVLESVPGYNTKDWCKGGCRPFDPVFMFKAWIYTPMPKIAAKGYFLVQQRAKKNPTTTLKTTS